MYRYHQVDLPVIKFMHLGAATASEFDRSARVNKKWVDYDGPLADAVGRVYYSLCKFLSRRCNRILTPRGLT